jgi:hypothetical protein
MADELKIAASLICLVHWIDEESGAKREKGQSGKSVARRLGAAQQRSGGAMVLDHAENVAAIVARLAT